jgi:hypothetical protein
MCVKVFFKLLYVVWTLLNMCILNPFFLILSSQYFEDICVCGFMNLFWCCCIYLYVLYLYDLFHILLLLLQTYGSMECMYVIEVYSVLCHLACQSHLWWIYIFQVFAEAVQKSYRIEVGLQCTIIRLYWKYPFITEVHQMYVWILLALTVEGLTIQFPFL